MEALSMEQILIYPYAIEITSTLSRLPNIKKSSVNSDLPMITIKKSAGETNDQKGSANLIVVP